MSTNRLSKSNLRYASNKQGMLMRLVLGKFVEYEKRNQPHFKLNGMSSSHIVEKAIEDTETMLEFWPDEFKTYDPRHGTLCRLGDGAMRKLHDNVRNELDRLAKRGYLEKVGNVNERRWLPHQDLLREIAQDYGHSSK